MNRPVSVSRIGSTQVGEERANVGKGNLHCASPDGLTAFGNFPCAVLLGKDLEEVDPVLLGEVGEGDVLLAIGSEKGLPDLLGLTSGTLGRSHDSPLAVRLDSAESTTCIVAAVGRQKIQERSWG